MKTSIVAVHGLNPKNTPNHATATWTAGDRLWLRDFLPSLLPEARIMLFAYNANVAFDTSAAGIREHAENILNWLKVKREVSRQPYRESLSLCHAALAWSYTLLCLP
jgi:hypothetical protein